VDGLSPAELDEILSTLKQHYVAPAELSEEALKRATVQGLIERLGSGVSLLAGPPAVPENAGPLKFEMLGENIGVHPPRGVERRRSRGAGQSARRPFSPSPSRPACSICGPRRRAWISSSPPRFAAAGCPKGKALFTVKRHDAPQEQVFTSKAEPKAHGLLTVLTSAADAGSAEVIAGTLRGQAKAIVIGENTKGEAGEYADFHLASGKLLRYATAEVQLSGGESIVPGGVKPDLPVAVSPEATAEVLRQELEHGVAPSLAEPSRPHMNEAALVAGKNPEVDAAEAEQQAHGDAKAPPARRRAPAGRRFGDQHRRLRAAEVSGFPAPENHAGKRRAAGRNLLPCATARSSCC